MLLSLGQDNSVATTSGTSAEVINAALTKKQQETQGQMAVKLIQSANIDSLPAPSENSGFQVNIKV
jgi:hypothetical protein